jgi:hypothetical protein
VSKNYGYARFWAGALTALWTLFVLIGFLVAVAAAILIPTIGGLFPSRGNDLLAGVAGQTLRVLLAQRRLPRTAWQSCSLS